MKWTNAQAPTLYTDDGAVIIRIGFWIFVYYSCNKEPPKSSIGNS